MRPPDVLRVPRRSLNLDDYRRRRPAEDDVATLVRDSALVYDDATGDLAIVYLVLDEDASEIEAALRRLRYDRTARTSGMVTNSRIFGHQPRNLPRRDFCTSASLARDDPAAHDLIAAYAARVSRYYEAFDPDRYRRHTENVEKVLPQWRLTGSVFTSGIINFNNPLPYHFDAGNFSDVWSNMLVFKHQIAGGHLAVPAFDLAFELPNNSLLMFDGQATMHGVTPILRLAEDAARYSIVFYSLKQMWSCLPIDEEIARVRKVRTVREFRRLAGAPDPKELAGSNRLHRKDGA